MIAFALLSEKTLLLFVNSYCSALPIYLPHNQERGNPNKIRRSSGATGVVRADLGYMARLTTTFYERGEPQKTVAFQAPGELFQQSTEYQTVAPYASRTALPRRWFGGTSAFWTLSWAHVTSDTPDALKSRAQSDIFALRGDIFLSSPQT